MIPVEVYCVLDFPEDHKTTKTYSDAYRKVSNRIMNEYLRSYTGNTMHGVQRVKLVTYNETTTNKSYGEYIVNFENEDKERTIEFLLDSLDLTSMVPFKVC